MLNFGMIIIVMHIPFLSGIFYTENVLIIILQRLEQK